MSTRSKKQRHRIRLEPTAGGYAVYQGRVNLGAIRSATEPSGRVAFVLGCDHRRHPRTYRGRELAVQALVALSKLVRRARRDRMRIEAIVLAAWMARPPASVKVTRH